MPAGSWGFRMQKPVMQAGSWDFRMQTPVMQAGSRYFRTREQVASGLSPLVGELVCYSVGASGASAGVLRAAGGKKRRASRRPSWAIRLPWVRSASRSKASSAASTSVAANA